MEQHHNHGRGLAIKPYLSPPKLHAAPITIFTVILTIDPPRRYLCFSLFPFYSCSGDDEMLVYIIISCLNPYPVSNIGCVMLLWSSMCPPYLLFLQNKTVVSYLPPRNSTRLSRPRWLSWMRIRLVIRMSRV